MARELYLEWGGKRSYVLGVGKWARKVLVRYWGYLALALAVLGAVEHLAVAAVLVLAGLAFVYLLLLAPLWCGAETREGLACRNNSRGLLLGCWIREHKWQRLKKAFVPARWGELGRSLFGSAKDGLATISAFIAIGTAAAAAIGHL
jgi:hypothetical protein